MTRRGRGLRSCKSCGAPTMRALCGVCSPTRHTTEHVDKYAQRRDESIDAEEIEPAGLPQWGGFDEALGPPEGF